MNMVRVGALALALAACGQDDAGNVMASNTNALSPEQVDLALGPEIANATEIEPEQSDEVNAAAPLDSPGGAPRAETAAEPETEPSNEPEPEPEPEEEPDDPPVDNNSVAE